MRKVKLGLLVVMLALLSSLLPLNVAAQDWEAIQDETVRRLSEYLAINTANPPGNEMRAAKYFAEWFKAEGIESEIFEVAPGRANLVARLKGNGSKKALILANHADVVNADASAWIVDPYSGDTVDGRIYGRGALDMKGLGMLQAMAFVILHREQVPLARDVVFVMTADEEVAFGGAEWLAGNQKELFDGADYILTEGGTNLVENGEVSFFGVDTAEKAPFWLRLIAEGTPGHGSRPKRDAASHRMARALARVVDWETPIVVIPGVEKFFRDVAVNESRERAGQFRNLKEAIKDEAFLRSLTESETMNYLLRNTVSLTVLEGAQQTNIIPNRVVAHLDVRLLPGEKPEDFMKQLRAVLADDSIQVEVITTPFREANESPTDNDFFRAVEATVEEIFPGTLVTTRMLSGATECSVFRPLGVDCYGVSPFLTSAEDLQGVHGNNENVSVENVRRGVRYLYKIVERIVR